LSERQVWQFLEAHTLDVVRNLLRAAMSAL
jgi:hypothetical protein